MDLSIAKTYWKSDIDNFCLNSNSNFGRRKYIHFGMSQPSSMGSKNNGVNKKWPHSVETLLKSRANYNVKFLGHIAVEEPKGVEIVKSAIKKLKFNKQLKKSEGVKLQKVELSISVDGVVIQDPKYKVIHHQFPLHKISYCADDKSDKRIITFIASTKDKHQHECFVFDSDKCAEEITLTIGEAFELAYKKYLEKSSIANIDVRKQYAILQKKVQQLTQENLQLKAKVADLERLIDMKVLHDFDNDKNPSVGRKLEGLVFDTDLSGQSSNHAKRITLPPPTIPNRNNQDATPSSPFDDDFASQNIKDEQVDAFGMPMFNASNIYKNEESDLEAAFSKGLAMDSEFDLEDLDPLKQ